MRQLSREAGMSIGNIYWYFSNKEDIIISIVHMFMEHIYAEIDNYKKSLSLIEFLHFITDTHLAGRSTLQIMSLTFEIISESTRNLKILHSIQEADLKFRMKLVEKCREYCSLWNEDEALNRVNAYCLLLYGYSKSKRLCPSIDENDVVACIDELAKSIFRK
jgi:AcrR family transcriptional regulator